MLFLLALLKFTCQETHDKDMFSSKDTLCLPRDETIIVQQKYSAIDILYKMVPRKQNVHICVRKKKTDISLIFKIFCNL